MQDPQAPSAPLAPESSRATYRRVATLAYPVVLSTLAATLMGLTDTLFMGWVSTAAQGGVGLGAILAWSFASLFVGTLTVINTFVAQHYGAGEEGRCGVILWHGLYIAAAVSLIVVPLAGQAHALVSLFGAPPAVGAVATSYAVIRVTGLPLAFAEACLTSFLRGLGDTRTPMKVSLGTVVLNVPLNFWLICGGLGVAPLGSDGAADATLAAQGAGVLVLSAVVFGRSTLRRRYQTSLPRPLVDRRLLGRLLQVGLPIGIGWMLEMATWTIFSAFVSRFGAQALAAHNIVLYVIHVSFMPGVGISVAATTLVGQHIGARDPEGAARSGYAALKLAIAYMAAMGVVFLLLGGVIASAFSREAEVVALARRIFLLAAAFQVFDAMGMVSGGILRGAGDTRYPMFLAAALAWTVFVPALWGLGSELGWGITGCWLGATAYIVLLGIVLFQRVLSGRWKSYSVTR